MSEDDLIAFISNSRAGVVLDHFAQMPLAERRKFAKAVMRLFKAAVWSLPGDPKRPKVRDDDAVIVALLATASLSELKAVKLWQLPKQPPIDAVLRKLQPDWLVDWVNFMVSESPHRIPLVAPVWENGLCPRPTSDDFILGYYARGVQSNGQIDEDIFLSQDVWRFFDVEGGGEFSLAACDKYAGRAGTWVQRLLDYEKAGKLDRGRLLDASLDALDRDFAQFVAGWYARFHKALGPEPDEIADRAPRYLRLLASTVPPTVSFAIQMVAAADKAGGLAPDTLLEALEPALQARAKGTVSAALRLVARAAKRDPSLAGKAAHCAALALVCEDAGVQGKALDLIEALGGPRDTEICAALAEYVPFAAPSMRARIAEMAGLAPETARDDRVAHDPAAAVAIAPVGSADAALALLLSVLEDVRDPFAVERAVDGIARYGADLRGNAVALSPLRKRARQLSETPQKSAVRLALAITGCDLADGSAQRSQWRKMDTSSPYHAVAAGSFGRLFMERNAQILAQVFDGHSLPMLSLPSDSAGCIHPDDLASRLIAYRDRGVVPGSRDIQLALLRLGQGGGAGVSDKLRGGTEAEDALRYALGADVTPGSDAALWAAAWAARQPAAPDGRIAGLFAPQLPDCGIAARSSLKVWRDGSRDGQYFWHRVAIPLESPDHTDAGAALPAMFYPPDTGFHYGTSPCGSVFEDVVWASLVRPGWQDPFFRLAILSLDPDQKLSDHFCLGFLAPLLRPVASVGPLGHTMLAYYLASQDKSLTSLTADVIAELALAEKLDAALFADGLKPFMMIDVLPLARWTAGFSAVAQAGAGGFSRDVIARLLDFAPEDTPRNVGGLLELLYELHIASDTVPKRPELLTCLKAMPGGGKVKKFASLLLGLAENGDSSARP